MLCYCISPLCYTWRRCARHASKKSNGCFYFKPCVIKHRGLYWSAWNCQVQFPSRPVMARKELVWRELYWQMRAGNGESHQDNANQPLINPLCHYICSCTQLYTVQCCCFHLTSTPTVSFPPADLSLSPTHMYSSCCCWLVKLSALAQRMINLQRW